MELDELKILFRSKQNVQVTEKSKEEIQALLGKKTVSVLSKINRSLRIELIACLFFTIALASVAIFTKYSSIRIYYLIFSFLCLLFIPVLWFLIKKVNRLRSEVLPVKSNLEQILNILKQYVKSYFQVTMALIPIAVLLSLWLGYNDDLLNNGHLSHNTFSLTSQSSRFIMFMLVYLLAFTTGMYYFTKWYLKKLYSNYLGQLQSLIKELEE